MSEGVWLVVGAQAAGKSTVAELLAQRCERSVHVRGGEFYRMAVRGWVHHDDANVREARRHLDLRYRLSASVADQYAAEGFTVVVQDNIFGVDVTAWLERVSARPRHLVVLRPSVAEIERREAQRRECTGKTAYVEGGVTPTELDRALALIDPVGLWMDTTSLSPTETVNEIVARRDEALVEGKLPEGRR